MAILADKPRTDVRAQTVEIRDNILQILLDTGQTLHIKLEDFTWLAWLAKASHEQQQNWSLDPGGFAIYWDDLDDGVEICHLLELEA